MNVKRMIKKPTTWVTTGLLALSISAVVSIEVLQLQTPFLVQPSLF